MVSMTRPGASEPVSPSEPQRWGRFVTKKLAHDRAYPAPRRGGGGGGGATTELCGLRERQGRTFQGFICKGRSEWIRSLVLAVTVVKRTSFHLPWI